MIAIKIQCGCGQRYAFDVEPVSGRLPAPVFCPVCRADGTTAANSILSERVQAATVVATAPRVAVAANGVAAPVQIPTAAPSAPRVSIPSAGVRVSPAVAAAP